VVVLVAAALAHRLVVQALLEALAAVLPEAAVFPAFPAVPAAVCLHLVVRHQTGS